MQPTVAELRFTAQRVVRYGVVLQMNAKEITVQLQSGPTTPELFMVNTEVELAVAGKTTMFVAATKIAESRDDVLVLTFTAPVRTVQRRKEQRIACELDVNYRAIKADGCTGIWKQGISRDISYAGICLIIEAGIEVPAKIEVLFMLADQCAPGALEMLMNSDDNFEIRKTGVTQRLEQQKLGTRASAIKATCQVVNKRQQADGRFAVGLSFTVLTPSDQLRIARFLSAHAVYGM